ncbi:MAG: DsbA family protein [Burkholderiaceae bacterium]|nr:DsbA family protein [Burkholderiaceae bacterium]
MTPTIDTTDNPEILNVPAAPDGADRVKSLIYVGDPMCSWCYGFGVPLDQLMSKLPDIPLTVVLGGLRAYNTDLMNQGLKDTLHHHWEEVHKRSGRPFTYGQFLANDFIYDTEPACRAVITIRAHAHERTLAMYNAIQRAFYAQSRDITQAKVLADIWEELLLSQPMTTEPFTREDFEQAFESDLIKSLTIDDFMIAQQWGIRGFPALIAVVNGQAQLVANGYMEADAILPRIEQVFADS